MDITPKSECCFTVYPEMPLKKSVWEGNDIIFKVEGSHR